MDKEELPHFLNRKYLEQFYLFLQNYNLNDNDIHSLFTILKDHPNKVDTLDLRSNYITEKGGKEIAEFLNEGKRKAENASKVVAIQDSLIGLDEVNSNINSFFFPLGSCKRRKIFC